MKTCWIVEDVTQASCEFVGAFSTPENAERIAGMIDGEVSERQIDPVINELNDGLTSYEITMDYFGEVERLEKSDVFNMTNEHRFFVEERTKIPGYSCSPPVSDVIQGNVWAKDEKHAIEIANEFRMRMIAESKMMFLG